MRLGLLAYATKTGLGYQTKAFYEQLKPDKTMVVDISVLNGQEQFRGMYNEAIFIEGIPNKNQIQRFLSGLDVMLFAETPLNYDFYTIANQMGVKTVNQYNPEFFDHIVHPDHPKPDLLINPSVWKFDEIDRWAKPNRVKHINLHLPVDRNIFKYRQRTTKKIMHVAGNPATHDRNGTWDFMHVRPNGTVTTQNEGLAKQIRARYRHSKVFTNIPSPESIYNFGDVLVLPRKYGGNCLPLNEALSCGLPVIMPDIEPNNNILPPEWLVPAYKVGSFSPRTEVDIYEVDPKALADKIDEIINQWDIAEESEKANQIAETISWQALKIEYIKAMESLL
jgi:hypothetical protein